MTQKDFAAKATEIVKTDAFIVGLAAGGSWINNEIDEYSDLDLVLVTQEKISASKSKMVAYANRFGKLLSAFTGEHVGESRLLICLYDDPLLHVDIKFMTAEEFFVRVEDPEILFDRTGALKAIIQSSTASFPYPDYQWMEDRFWTWTHYALLKIGRGEYFEALGFLAFLRTVVLGPLLLVNNGHLPKGVRKLETMLPGSDIEQMRRTIATYEPRSILKALQHTVDLYRQLRHDLFVVNVAQQEATEQAVMKYMSLIQAKLSPAVPSKTKLKH